MYLAAKYRIYPTDAQIDLFSQHFNGVRLVYNLALETKRWAYLSHGVSLSRYELQTQLKDLKKEYQWLQNLNSQSLSYALLNLDTAFKNFYNGHKKFPKYKNKHSRKVFCCPQNAKIHSGKIYLPKFAVEPAESSAIVEALKQEKMKLRN